MQPTATNVCKECGKSFKKLSGLRSHLKRHERFRNPAKQYTCDQCGKPYRYRYLLLRHKKIHSCDYCNEVFTASTSKFMLQHMENHHSDMKKFACPTCGKAFFRKDSLKSHAIMHSNVKPHMCEVCGATFTLSTNLFTHKRIHTGERPYICNHCGLRFTQHSTLRTHEVNHFDKKYVLCNFVIFFQITGFLNTVQHLICAIVST